MGIPGRVAGERYAVGQVAAVESKPGILIIRPCTVLCCDGTGNEYGPKNTNVVGVFEAIVRDAEQVGFYDPGVGTFSTLGRAPGKWVGRVLGKGFGWGLQQNVEDAYEYLMNHYEAGNRLYLFGFSRRAYTARCLAGMLHK